MLQFDHFAFCAPPLATSWWVLETFRKSGLIEKCGLSYELPPEGYIGYVLSVVEHPITWLHKVFICGSELKKYLVFPPKFQELVLDGCPDSFEAFLLRIKVNCPNLISEVFDQYKATSVIRIEDLPHSAFEFMESFGISIPDEVRRRPPPTSSTTDRTKPHIATLACSIDPDFCDRYEYF